MKRLDLGISFIRSYYTKHFGLRYGREYFEDVRVRAETDAAAARALWSRFGDIGLGSEANAPCVRLGYDDTLNITLMFGGELRIEGGVSWVEPGFVSAEEARRLAVPRVEETWPHTMFLEQYEEAVRVFGAGAVAAPRVHGILEAVLEMRGAAFAEDLMLDPEGAGRLLDVLVETVIAMKEFWDRRCRDERRSWVDLGGCSTTMLSSETVRRFLVGRYSRIARHFGEGSICSCGASTHNLGNFAAVEETPHIRVGWGTDLAEAARVLSAPRPSSGDEGLRPTRSTSIGADAPLALEDARAPRIFSLSPRRGADRRPPPSLPGSAPSEEVDMSANSRLGALRDRHVLASLSVVRAAELPREGIEKDVRAALRALEPVERVTLLLVNAGEDTSEENVRGIHGAAREFARERGIAFGG